MNMANVLKNNVSSSFFNEENFNVFEKVEEYEYGC